MQTEKQSRVFITGASGFVGANIVRYFVENNYEVHVINHSNTLSWRLKEIKNKIHIYKVDLTNFIALKKTLKKIYPDYIIHLAAYGAYSYQDDIDKIFSVNIDGLKNLLKASQDIPYKLFINTGSSSEYGFKDKPMKETDYCDPVSYYAVTKLAATTLCKVFAMRYEKPIITFRLFSVYGPYEEPTRFIPVIMKSLLKNETINITPGKQRRDFIYITDVIDAYAKAMKSNKKFRGEICNIGTGMEYTNDEIVKKLFQVTKTKTKIQKGSYPKRIWDTDHWVANNSNAQKVLSWKPVTTIDKGLQNTYAWVEKNIQFYG